ncbi:AAA family ATPase [Staphylococcus aureus]
MGQIPNHLKDGHYQGARSRPIYWLQISTPYVNGYVSQQYLPDKLKNKIYYETKNDI